jgi:hypothetical protein
LPAVTTFMLFIWKHDKASFTNWKPEVITDSIHYVHFPSCWILLHINSLQPSNSLIVESKGLRLLIQQGHEWQHFLVKFIPIYTITTYLSTILHLFLISFMFHVETSQIVSPSNSVSISHFLHPSYRSIEHVNDHCKSWHS